jgi:hypothetical protein
LGAGCGLLGCLVARNTPTAAEVCLTEQAFGGALEHLRLNVQANRQLPNMGSVTTCACDWTHFMNAQLVQAVRSGAAVGNDCTKSLQDSAAAGVQQQQQQTHLDGLVQPQQQQQPQESTEPVQVTNAAGQGSNSSSSSSSSAASLSAAELADMSHLLCSRWDIIIGSDLVYNSAGGRLATSGRAI